MSGGRNAEVHQSTLDGTWSAALTSQEPNDNARKSK
jgi:hypothetical protein